MTSTRLAVLAVPSCAFLIVLAGSARGADTTRVNGRIVIPVDDDGAVFDGDALGDATIKGGIGLSHAPTGRLRERLIRATRSGELARTAPLGGSEVRGTGEGRDDSRNVQINDPALDHIVTFDPAVVVTRPFEFATESETSGVRDGKHVVVGYNSSANATVQFFPGLGLAFTKLMFSAFSVSHDGGRTWTSGFVPAVSDDAPFTFGDPALAMDRRGNIFYASLGTDAAGEHGTLIINKSTDHGSSFGTATVVAVDDGSDKEWLAIGPDPTAPSRDNVYVTWTSFQFDKNGATIASQLWLARSTDGGHRFSSKPLFAPVDDGINSAFIQFSNPVVDASTGRLYIPFLHFSDGDADNVRVLVSDDGGLTFTFLRFDVKDAVDAFAFPNVTPGLLNDCTGGGVRNALVAGADQGGGRFGLPVFKQVTRLISQPHAAASRGTFLFVLNTSTSRFFGDPTAGSEINLVVSRNGGRAFAPAVRVVSSTAADPQHVHPAVSLSRDAENLTVSYYVQQSDQRLRTDVAGLELDGGRVRIKSRRPLSSTAFDLTPSNIVRTRTPSTVTTNFDRTIVSCYDIGEYQTLARSTNGDDVTAAWGDNRQRWTSPPGSPGAGTHAQPDVFATTPDED
jgi:hypothetical protein